jgi:hypothetical protein
MHGSPTLLVDGSDPFAEPEEPASVSCRLYRYGNGQVDGAPSVSQLRQAIGEAAATAADADTPSWLDAAGRCGRGRIAPAERGLRAVHQAVLRSFAATGRTRNEACLTRLPDPLTPGRYSPSWPKATFSASTGPGGSAPPTPSPPPPRRTPSRSRAGPARTRCAHSVKPRTGTRRSNLQ